MPFANGISNFRAKVLLSFVAVFVISWLSIVLTVYVNLEDERKADQEELRQRFLQIYRNELDSYFATFSAGLETLTHPSRIANSFTVANKPFFFSNFRADFSNLNQRNLATHMYFSTAERVNIIRLHAPDINGDTINRTTTLAAHQTGETIGGVEMSKLGSLAYRVVKPIFGTNGLRGFVELGRELDDIWSQAANQLDISIIIAIDKDHITQERWEKARDTFNHQADWDTHINYVEIGRAIVQPGMEDILTSILLDKNLQDDGSIQQNEEFFHYSKIQLYDYSDAPMAIALFAYPQKLLTGDLLEELGAAASASAIALTIGLIICFLLLSPVANSMQNRQVELEKEVLRQTQDLRTANEEALQAKEAAEIASKAKSEFLSNMSHELRTPLNAIIGFSSIVKNDELGEGISSRYQSYIGNIHSSGTHLLNIINDILDLSRIEAGRLVMRFQPISTRSILHECHQMINAKATERGIAVIHDNYDETVDMDADPTRLKQILLNLLSNAVKFTDPPGTIRFYAKKISDTEVEFAVIDEGVGVSEEDQEVVLMRFGQATRSMLAKKKEEGTGLGLNLVQDLVKQHKGTFTFESTAGVGTKARFILPLQQEGAESYDII